MVMSKKEGGVMEADTMTKAKVDKSRDKAIDLLDDLNNINIQSDVINQWYLDCAKKHVVDCINCLGILASHLTFHQERE